MNNEKQRHYGLITAITMIIGIVVGSGIFFKADDVLLYTGGNVPLSVLVFIIGALSIIFGSLTLTELSMRTEKSGGVVGYYEDFISKEVASAFGWFQTFVYFPTVMAVVSWVAALYTTALLGMDATLEMEILIGLLYMILAYGVNILSVTLGGHFQNLTTFIKLIPLLGVALIGVFWGNPNPTIPQGVELITTTDVGWRWLAALAPIAFSYDGWVVSTTITPEVKNPQKNMTLALIIGPLIVLSVYLLYFLGLNNILGSEFIMTMGDNAINEVGYLLFGDIGNTVLLVFIIIAVLGVVNGLTLGSLRMPQALASKNMIPHSEEIAKIHPKYQLSLKSCMVSFVVAVVWMVIHYISQKGNVLQGGDISEIAIVFSYVCYTILYVKVMMMKKSGVITSTFKGIICPIFGLLGSGIILIGGIISNPLYVPIFIFSCLVVGMMGYIYYKKNNEIHSDH